MKIFPVAAILSFLLMTSAVFALDITVTTNTTKVLYGETFVLKGTIASDNGTSGTFDYRAAVVAPKGIIICDTNKTKTAADGTFTLTCKAPTKGEAISLGIPAAANRAVIPLKAGVVVFDPINNATVKRHAKEVLAINPEKFTARLTELSANIDRFVKEANTINSECDKLIERAQKFNVTSVSAKCQSIKDKVNGLIADATNISAQAKLLSSNLSSSDLQDFKAGLSIIKGDMKDLRNELKEIREQIKSIKWEILKEVKEVRKAERKEIRGEANKTREGIKEVREKAKEEIKSKREDLKDRIKQIRNKTEGGLSR